MPQDSIDEAIAAHPQLAYLMYEQPNPLEIVCLGDAVFPEGSEVFTSKLSALSPDQILGITTGVHEQLDETDDCLEYIRVVALRKLKRAGERGNLSAVSAELSARIIKARKEAAKAKTDYLRSVIGTTEPNRERLGVDYDLPGVDPEYVEPFAKTVRVVGLATVLAFVIWGLFSEGRIRYGLFGDISREFSIRRETGAALIAIALSAAGYFWRFQVGILVMAIFIWGGTLVRRLFRAV